MRQPQVSPNHPPMALTCSGPQVSGVAIFLGSLPCHVSFKPVLLASVLAVSLWVSQGAAPCWHAFGPGICPGPQVPASPAYLSLQVLLICLFSFPTYLTFHVPHFFCLASQDNTNISTHLLIAHLSISGISCSGTTPTHFFKQTGTEPSMHPLLSLSLLYISSSRSLPDRRTPQPVPKGIPAPAPQTRT